MNWRLLLAGFCCVFSSAVVVPAAISEDHVQVWMKLAAKDAFERTIIADTGVSIEIVREDYVMAIGSTESLHELESLGRVLNVSALNPFFDFPTEDQSYHNSSELETELRILAKDHPKISQLISIGKSTEGKDILDLRISGDLTTASEKAGILYVGGHHAREHLSVEVPLMLAQYILKEYAAGNGRIQRLVDTRDIHIVPALNPDGLEYDVGSGRYKYWRKNRRDNKDRTYGVDLNRNYAYKWGNGGSSNRTNDETYMGPSPFSEPETLAIKNLVEKNTNLNVVLSYHTFSELILYPWGYTTKAISEAAPRKVHEVMAKQMSKWNGYSPMPSSALYTASGDLTDWTYGVHKMISFTFELDPQDGWSSAGFYPGSDVIPEVFRKNLEPALYLMEYSDDPARVLSATAQPFSKGYNAADFF